MFLPLETARPPDLIASITSSRGASCTAFQFTLPLPRPSFARPKRFTRPWKELLEFLPVVAALRRVRIRASRMEGTWPQPATTSEGAGMVSGWPNVWRREGGSIQFRRRSWTVWHSSAVGWGQSGKGVSPGVRP